MAYYADDDDAFTGGVKIPSLSWKGLPIGSIFTVEILAPAKILHSRDFETGEPAYWDPLTKQNPKLSAVVNVQVLDGAHSVGEQRSIWAQRPSDLYTAIATAQKEAGAKLQPGGILKLKFTGETPHDNPRLNAIKNYAARYEPPSDGFANAPTPPPQYAQPAQPTQQRPASWGSAPAEQGALPGTQSQGAGEAVPFNRRHTASAVPGTPPTGTGGAAPF